MSTVRKLFISFFPFPSLFLVHDDSGLFNPFTNVVASSLIKGTSRTSMSCMMKKKINFDDLVPQKELSCDSKTSLSFSSLKKRALTSIK